MIKKNPKDLVPTFFNDTSFDIWKPNHIMSIILWNINLEVQKRIKKQY